MMETIGLGDWNIDMVRAESVVREVADRYRSLARLEALRKKAQPAWNELYQVIVGTFHQFARDVLKYVDSQQDGR